MLCLFVGTGIYLTLLLGLPQVRYFGIMSKEIFGKKADKAKSGDKSISSFAAMATAMAATVGTGNIAGVATALHLGGPGALIWMLIWLCSACTSSPEVSLAVHFRERMLMGTGAGVPCTSLKKAQGRNGWQFCLRSLRSSQPSELELLSQANSTAEALQSGFNIDPLHSGIALSVLTALVIIGGLQSLSTVTTLLVPFMAIFYIGGSLIVLVVNAAHLPGAIAAACKYAFSNPMALPGAIAGWSVKMAITKGIARGVFSNKAQSRLCSHGSRYR